MPELELGAYKPIDAHTAFAHIGTWPLIRVGAKNKLSHKDHIQFDMTVDGGRKRRCLVQLNGQDLYNVEVGRLKGRALDWVSEHVVYDILAHDLPSVIEYAFEQVMSKSS